MRTQAISHDDAFFSILIPTLNESDHIYGTITSLLPSLSRNRGEILVIDGGSIDGTREIVEGIASVNSCVRLLHNPLKIQSAACNLGAREAHPRSSVLIRADAHASYPCDFIELCLSALQQTGATSIVVPMVTIGRTPLQKAIARAQNSRLGNGGSKHRRLGTSGIVDHGHHAAFDRSFFLALGGYDESFTHNEDAEFDRRATSAGGRIWLCTEAAIGYFPRCTFPALARQYRRHGSGRARTLLKHRMRPRARQMLPIACLMAAVLTVPGLIFYPLLAPALCYALICLCWSAASAVRRREPYVLAAGPALIVMHVAWAWGFMETVFSHRGGFAATGRSKRGLVRSFFTIAR